jgi:hypothetical protein
MDRRVCLLQDPLYRLETAMNAMGYLQDPSLTYLPEAVAPNLNLTAVERDGEVGVRAVVSAPLDRAVKGSLRLSADGVGISPAETAIDLKPGERRAIEAVLAGSGGDQTVTARLTGSTNLIAVLELQLPDKPLQDVPMVQAEAYSGQGGGEVQKRDDKVGVVGGAISHWDAADHWLEWRIDLPRAGRHHLLMRYSTPNGAVRGLSIDGRPLPDQAFVGSGGFGSLAGEWWHHRVSDGRRQPLAIDLSAGPHTIRMMNLDGQGLNLDYLALVPLPDA